MDRGLDFQIQTDRMGRRLGRSDGMCERNQRNNTHQTILRFQQYSVRRVPLESRRRRMDLATNLGRLQRSSRRRLLQRHRRLPVPGSSHPKEPTRILVPTCRRHRSRLAERYATTLTSQIHKPAKLTLTFSKPKTKSPTSTQHPRSPSPSTTLSTKKTPRTSCGSRRWTGITSTPATTAPASRPLQAFRGFRAPA